jgi:acetyl esterase/lipase
VHRRTLLSLPALCGLAALTGCADEEDRSVPDSEPEAGSRTVTYGADPAQYGELTLPSGHPRGVAVLVHGGFWKPEYGIEYATPMVPSLVEAGWATWAIEYRRGTGAADTLADVRAAIDKLPDLGLDLSTVVGIGHSAGGHLVTWAAGHGDLTHVVAQAGVLDLTAAYDEGLGGGAVETFLGHRPGPADAAVDPVRQVPLDVPVWCVHGTSDQFVPIEQSRSYVAAATAAGGTAELVEVDGDHFVVVDPGSGAWAKTLAHLEVLA